MFAHASYTQTCKWVYMCHLNGRIVAQLLRTHATNTWHKPLHNFMQKYNVFHCCKHFQNSILRKPIWLQNTLQNLLERTTSYFRRNLSFCDHQNHKCSAWAQWMLKQMVQRVTTVFQRVWASAVSYNKDNPVSHMIPSVHLQKFNTNRTAFPLQTCCKRKIITAYCATVWNMQSACKIHSP